MLFKGPVKNDSKLFCYRLEIEARKGLLATCKKALGRFPLNQNFRKFRNVDIWYGNFLGKLPEYLEIVEFSKSEPFTLKFREFQEKSQMEQKFLVRNVGKFRYTLQGCLRLWKLPAVKCSSIRHWKFKPEFFIEWEAPLIFLAGR